MFICLLPVGSNKGSSFLPQHLLTSDRTSGEFSFLCAHLPDLCWGQHLNTMSVQEVTMQLLGGTMLLLTTASLLPAASMKLHVIKSLQERLNVYKRSKRAFISPSSSHFTHRNDGLHSARLEISLSWKRRLTISIRLRNVWLARCGRGAHVTRINSKDPSTTQYLHVSQVLQRFEHPPLYVFNFYPLYAPGG